MGGVRRRVLSRTTDQAHRPPRTRRITDLADQGVEALSATSVKNADTGYRLAPTDTIMIHQFFSKGSP
jgi:hypothetical protein